MKKHLQLLVLLAAFLLPWVMQAQISCPPGEISCQVTVLMSDDYGDGWDEGDDYLTFYQGTTSRGTATLSSYVSSGTATIDVCSGDSVAVVWVATGDYYDECMFVIQNGSGQTVFTCNDATSLTSGDTICKFMPTCPSCPIPTNFTALADTANVFLSWGGSATSYEVIYGIHGFDTNTDGTYVSYLYDDTLTVTGLTVGTTYDFYVRANCTGENSPWIGPAIAKPTYTYTMNTTGTDTLYACGYTIYDDGGETGAYSINCSSTLILLPNDPTQTLVISGSSYTESTWDYLRIYDGIGTSGTQLWNDYGVSTLQTFGPFISDEGAITIVFTSDGSVTYDGFSISVSCVAASNCVHPDQAAVANITDQSAEISWNERGTATSWQIEYGPAGFTPGDAAGTIETAYTNPYTLSGLAPNTAYDVYISSDCGSELSLGTMVSFRTACTAIDSLPYFYGFEDATSASTSGQISNCWKKFYYNGSSVVTNNYPYPSLVAATGSRSLYFYSYYYNPSYCYAALPLFDDSLANLQITFKLRAGTTGSSYINALDLGVMTNPEDATTFTSIGTYTATSSSTWDTYTAYLSDYTGTGRYIAFKSTIPSGSASYNYVYLDDITVDYAPECGPVTNIDVTTATNAALISWIPSSVGEYAGATVEYRAAGDSTAAWQSLTTTETYIGITGLDTNTVYDLRIQANCGSDNAQWTLSQFTTGAYPCILIDTSISFNDTIGQGASTSSYIPSYSFYKYSLTQQIYRASDFSGSAMGSVITKIGFQLAAMPITRNWKIYVSSTTADNLTSGFIPVTDADLVWTGSTSSLTANAWNEITLANGVPINGNILVTFQDLTGSYSSGNYGSVTSTGISGISRYIYQDGAAYDPTSTVSGGTASDNRLNMYFTIAGCQQQQTCVAPILRAEATGTDEISLNWVPGNGETSWNVYYRAASDTTYTLAGVATTNSYTVSSLAAASEYFFKVASICGTTEGGAAETSLYTACGLVPVPFFEDFESEPNGEIFNRPCWLAGTTNLGTDYPYPLVIRLTGDPNELLILYNGAYFVMPKFDAQLNTLQARFTLVQGGDNVRLMLGLLDDLNSPISTVHPLDTLIRSEMDSVNSTVIVTYPFDFLDDSVTGHIVFYDAWSDNYNFLDDIHIEVIPNCTSITGVTVSNVTGSSADVAWEIGGTATTGYLVEYGDHGFALGTGTQVTASTNATALTGLNTGTTYDVYVYAICSATGDTSVASNVAHFTTECAAVSLPYMQNFDNVQEPGSTAKVLPNCWNYVMTATGTYAGPSYLPTAYYTTTANYTSSGQYCLRLYGSAITVLPEMPTTVDSLMITFYEYNSSPSDYKLIIGAVDSITPGFEASFTPIDTIQYTSAYQYNHLFFLNSYTGNGRYIAFKNYYEGNSYDYSYHYIDDIVVDYVPSCIYPMHFSTTGASTTTADIAWTTSNATDYEYEYGVTGFARGTGTTGTCTGLSCSLTGLTISTTYDIYVRGVCGAGDTSEWRMYTFSTLNADPATVPYVCDFTDTTLVNCGFEFVNSANNAWYVGNATSNGTANSLYISNDGGTSNAYTNTATQVSYAYRDLALTTGGEYAYTFDWVANGESSYDYLRAWLAPVGFSFTAGQTPDGGTSTYSYTSSNPAGWIPLDGGSKLNLASGWQTQSGEVVVPAGTYHLVFMWGNDGSGGTNPPAAVDNIQIFLNTCPKVREMAASNVTASSLTLTWTDTVPGIEWQVEYGPAGFAHGDANAVVDVASTQSYTATGLTSLTSYDFYVRHICSATDTGMWNKLNVQTGICDNPGIAYSYDSTMTASTNSYAPMGSSFYNYGYVQTLVDAAQLADLGGDITAMAFSPATANMGEYYTNMNIYLANVSDSVLTGFIVPDSTHQFVQVTHNADLTYTTAGWQIFGLDTAFTWDGHSNLLVSVQRNHGSYSSGASFNVHNTSNTRTYYAYQDGGVISITSPTSAVSTGSGSFVGDFQFISCAEGCAKPVIASETHDYGSITFTWTGDGTDYEVAIKESATGAWPAETAVTGNTYTFNGLAAATSYDVRVRQNCGTELGYSDWAQRTIVTDSLPCFAPTGLTVSGVSFNEVRLNWTPGSTETEWVVRVYRSDVDIYDTVTAYPATIGGLYSNMTYSAAVQAKCGGGAEYSDWSETIQFTTEQCMPVTNVQVSNITTNSATIGWTAASAASTAWQINYGDMDFQQGTGTFVEVSANPYTLTDLQSDYYYDVYVRTSCATDLYSDWSAKAEFHTLAQGGGEGIDDVEGLNVNIFPNPTSGATTIALSGINGKVTIAVVDMNGRTVSSSEMECGSECSQRLDVAGLAQGAYFVRIYGENVNMVKKLIVR